MDQIVGTNSLSDQNVSAKESTTNRLNREKLLGYLLLLIGLSAIIMATIAAFQLLTGKIKPPIVFETQAPTIKLPSASSQLQLPEGMVLPPDLVINQTEGVQAGEVKLLSDEVFSGLINSGLYYVAMMFIASSGAKFAHIGVKLINDIKLNVKT